MTSIRAATAQDADAIAGIYVDTWRDTYAGVLPDAALLRMSERGQALNWRHALSRRRATESVLVAEGESENIVGFGSCGRSRARGLDYAGEVFTLYVHPDHQNMGCGRQLLRSLFLMLLQRRLESAVVWVVAENPSRFFYYAMGGAWVAEREEILWGVPVRQLGFGWADLSAAVAPTGPCAAV